MYKNRVAMRRGLLLAGQGSTLPLRISAINHGWKPEETPIEIAGTPIHSIVNRDIDDGKTTEG